MERLREVGISGIDDLRALGSLNAYLRLKFRFPTFTSLNALYALEGALLDCDWRHLPAERRNDLRRALQVLTLSGPR